MRTTPPDASPLDDAHDAGTDSSLDAECVIAPCHIRSPRDPDASYRYAADPFEEARERVAIIAQHAVAYANAVRDDGGVPRFPPSAPVTPAAIPAGVCDEDPAGTWGGFAWGVLRFSVDDVHRFSYAFLSERVGVGATFRASAHGNFDGRGESSTFEYSGQINARLEVDVGPLQVFHECE